LLHRHAEEPRQPVSLQHVGDSLAALPPQVGHPMDTEGQGDGLLRELVAAELPLRLADRSDVTAHLADRSTPETIPLHAGIDRM
jgi:hypothetical protein